MGAPGLDLELRAARVPLLFALLTATGPLACGSPWLPLPEWPPGAESVLVIAETPEPAAWANHRQGAPLPVELPSSTPVWALYFEASLAELGLEVGSVPLPAAGAPGRAVPPAEAVFALRGGAWVSAERATWPIRLSAADPQSCAEAGGCFLDEEPVCRPCSPTPPAPPTLPAPPGLACPPGWARVSAGAGELGAERCDPALRSCSGVELALPGTACAAPSPCPAALWPPGEGSHVAPGPRGGDGSRERPHGSIAEALQAGARTLLLSAGTHPLPPELPPEPIELRGLCAEQTSLDNPERLIVRGPLTLRGLRLTRALEIEGALVAEAVWFEDLEVRDLQAARIGTGRLDWTGTGTVTELYARGPVSIAAHARVTQAAALEAVQVSGALRAERLSAPELIAQGGRLELDGVHVAGLLRVVAGRLEAQRSSWRLQELRRAQATVEDVVGGLLSCEDCELSALRAFFGGVHCSGELRSDLRLEDVTSGSDRQKGLLVLDDCGLRATRLRLSALADWALHTSTRRDVHITDATLSGAAGAWFLQGRATLERAHITARSGIGLRTGDPTVGPDLTLRDLTVEDVAADGCTSTDLCWGAAAQLGGGRISLERFRLARSAYGMIVIASLVDATEGLIEANGTALRLDEGIAAPAFVRRVRYEGNTRWCEGCRPSPAGR